MYVGIAVVTFVHLGAPARGRRTAPATVGSVACSSHRAVRFRDGPSCKVPETELICGSLQFHPVDAISLNGENGHNITPLAVGGVAASSKP